MEAKRQLGEFLKARRSHLRPEDVGLADRGERRRVPGLRREELAQLAGVSAPYYSRLEQGQSTKASPEVLDALAGALRLNPVERQHLHDLAATARRPRARRPPPERVTPGLRELLAALGDVPALLVGRRLDVLAWNRAGHALFAGHVPPELPGPNVLRLLFLDPHTRELYPDWPAKARAAVAMLRLSASGHFDDPALAALVGELSVASPEFARLWADQRVKSGGDTVLEMHHPLVGALTVTQQALRTEHGFHLVLATAEPGSSSQAALTLLTHTTATSRQPV